VVCDYNFDKEKSEVGHHYYKYFTMQESVRVAIDGLSKWVTCLSYYHTNHLEEQSENGAWLDYLTYKNLGSRYFNNSQSSLWSSQIRNL